MSVQDDEMQAHTTQVVAWDIPSPVVAGGKFRIRAGVKCSSECGLAHEAVEVYDHEARHVASATLSGDLWPGTTALHVAEIELDAPPQEGLYTWTVRGPAAAAEPAVASEAALPHAEGSASFGVRVVSAPDCLVTVTVAESEAGTPMPGASVVMHPYRAVTDERGVASLRVARGSYRLFVSQTRYLTFGLLLEVDGDVTTRAELSLEPVPERN